MANLVLELARSADWAAGVVFVNGHGGNHAAVTRPSPASRPRAATRWPGGRSGRSARDGGPRDLHAGRIETSLMLAIDPGLVRFELAEPGPDASIDELRAKGVRAVSPSGVLGDPRRRVRAARANDSSRRSSRIWCTRSRSGGRSTRRRPVRTAADEPMEAMRYCVDGSWRRFDRVVIAGSPLRIFRLTDAGTAVADARSRPVRPWPVAPRRPIARRRRDPPAAAEYGSATGSPSTTSPSSPRSSAAAVVASDGTDRGRRRFRPALAGATVRHAANRGPAAARNAGRRLVDTPLVAFVDADVTADRPAGSSG